MLNGFRMKAQVNSWRSCLKGIQTEVFFVKRINDIEAKRLVLDNGLDKVFKDARKASYKGDNSKLEEFNDCFGDRVEKACRNLEQSRIRKARTMRKRVRLSVTLGNAYFITLTFKDDILASTSKETRRRYVSRAFKAIGYKYVANIDYGGKNGREHYHGIIEPLPFCFNSWENGSRKYENVPDFEEWTKKYGFVTIEKIGSTDKDLKKVSKYTAKLSAHAFKETVLKGEKSDRVIYSKKRISY